MKKRNEKILIIDDNENILETLGDVLKEKGFNVKTAETGNQAIQRADEEFFNLNLVDMQLPDMTGIDILREMKRKFPARMNVIITAHATVDTALDALRLGANAYVMKPIDFETLDRIIAECLEIQRKAMRLTSRRVSKLITI